MNSKGRYVATPAQLVRSLCGLENWIKGIRKVLAQMDPDQEIVLREHLPHYAAEYDNMPYVKGCPPPDIYQDPNGDPVQVKGCPPPDWYQEPCR
jgi:hypothetical protein